MHNIKIKTKEIEKYILEIIFRNFYDKSLRIRNI